MGYALVVEALLADGRADPLVYNSTPLVNAALNGHTRIVQLLLEDGRADRSAIFSSKLRSSSLVNARALIGSVVRWHRRRPWLSAAA
jgi:hypothetical protein